MDQKILSNLKSQVAELEGTCRIRINLTDIDTHSLSVKDRNTIVHATEFVKRAEGRIKKILVLKLLELDVFESEVIISEAENVIRRHTEYNVPNSEYNAPRGWDSVTT